MTVITHDEIVADPWLRPGDDAIPAGRDVIVGYARWTREREDILRTASRVGVQLASDQPPSLIAADLDRLALVALEFPRFTDGRAYSYARLLRSRYGFRGEVRAVGNVLRDQLDFMRRCGFHSFELPDGADVAAGRRAFGEIPVRYQDGTDDGPAAYALRAGAGTPPPDGPAGCWAY